MKTSEKNDQENVHLNVCVCVYDKRVNRGRGKRLRLTRRRVL